MSDFDAFAQDCKDTSRNLRRLPSEVKKRLGAEVQGEVAEPLAQKMRAATRGAYARPAAASVKARKLSDPTIVVGGAKKVTSEGARGRDIIFGVEFGGGKKVSTVPATPRHRAYRRHTTMQFVRNKAPFIFPTISKNGGWVLEKFADIVDRVIGEEMGRG